MTSAPRLRLGTRASPLARAQAETARARLEAAWPELAGRIEVIAIATTGDKVLDRPLSEIGGKGLFTKELEEALLDRRIDLAVHSLKDVATAQPDGLDLAAVLPRASSADCLVAGPEAAGVRGLADLPQGAVLGTASLRRQAQALALRPDLKVVTMRGNVGTRLDKLSRGAAAATMLARAGLDRLGLDLPASVDLSADEMLPAAAQGAVALQIRTADAAADAFVRALDDPRTRACVLAERALLAGLDGSCRTPIAALATLDDGEVALDGLVALPDGSALHRGRLRGPAADAVRIGAALADELRGRAGPAFFARLAEISANPSQGAAA